MTISTWVNPEEVVNWARVFDFGNGKGSPPYPNLFLTVHSSDGNTRLAYEDGDNSHLNTGAFTTNTWTHIAITIEGSKAVMYVNGAKVAENTGFHMIPSQITYMTSNYLGKSNYSADSLFKGDLDDFRIYNRALGTDEITALANGEEPIRTVQTVEQPEGVETQVGTAPVLPEKVKVTYTNGTEGRESVIWDEVPAEKYSKAGTFEVKGKVGDIEVKITVAVKEEVPADLPFVDVEKDDWFYNAVYYNYFAETMTGKDKIHFAPYEPLARAQFALILYRMNDTPEVEYEDVFPDVQDDIWYTDAILWAAKTGVVTGYTDTGKFGPADKINREQMAVMMYRYANYKEYESDAPADISGYKDADKVNTFAKDAMEWAVGNGIISGKDGGTVLDPQGDATRAECATIIMRFMEKYNK